MTLRTRFYQQLTVACCTLLLGAFAACSSKETTTANMAPAKLTVKGVVLDESGAAIAGAAVQAGDVNAVTDASGGYVLQPNYKLGEFGVFTVSKAKYGTRSQTVAIDLVGLSQNFTLRPVSVSQSVALPTAADTNVQITFAAADANNGGITLSIAPNTLVTAAGAPAQGNVDVDITYWGPNDALTNTPSPMFGYQARSPNAAASAMFSYGMGDIHVSQSGQALQVAAGANLTLSFNLPPVFADAMASIDPNDAAAPRLWSVDENNGIWVGEGSLTDGRLAYDATAKQVHAALPHLSAWNIDGIDSHNGCVTGTLVDCNAKPVANTQAWLWMLGKGTLGHAVLSSGADGTFCGAVTGAGSLASKSTATGEAFTWVSLPSAPSSTSSCNPTQVASYAELCLGRPASSLLCRASEDEEHYAAGLKKCGTTATSFTMCGYCAGSAAPSGKCTVRQGEGTPYQGLPFVSGQCTNLGNVKVPTSACGNANTTDPCANKGDQTGAECSTDVDCCPQASLECSDGRCVPRTKSVN